MSLRDLSMRLLDQGAADTVMAEEVLQVLNRVLESRNNGYE